jgi:tetratricopeptide (TPR) repeat protein
LAEVYRSLGKNALALRLYQDAIKILRIVHGSCHPEVIKCLIQESALQSQQTNFDAAKAILQECLGLTQQLHGEEHEEVAAVLSALAWVYKNDGDYQHSKKIHEKALGMRIKVFGDRHPSVAKTLSDIGDLMESMGKFDDALALHEQALRMRQDAYAGDQHRDVALSHFSLGKIFKRQNAWDFAAEELRTAIRIFLSTDCGKDPILATAYNELATVEILLSPDGHLDVAVPLYEKALDIRIARFGRVHAETAESMHDLACILSVYPKERAHERALAVLFFEDAYRVRSDLYSEQTDHPDVVKTLTELCALLIEENLWSLAAQYVFNFLEVKRREHPMNNHVDLVEAYSYAGLVTLRTADALRKSDLSRAKNYAESALKIAQVVCEERDEKTANAFTLLADVREAQGKLNKARALHEQALQIRRVLFMNGDLSVAESLESIGHIRCASKRYEKAVEAFAEALEIRRALSGDFADEFIAYTLSDISRTLQKDGRNEEAKPYASEAYIIRNMLARSGNNLLLAESMVELAAVQSSLGEYSDARLLLQDGV